MEKKLYKVEIQVWQYAIVEAENEEEAEEIALDMSDSEREWDGQEVNEVYRCDEDGNFFDDEKEPD